MRVADRSTARNYLTYLNKAKNDYAKTNERVASGVRFKDISEDVSAGSRVIRTKTDLYKAQKQLDNVKGVNEEMTTTENAMTDISDILTEIHNVKVTAAKSENAGASGRSVIAGEIKSLQQEILQFANTQYGKKYVFGGTNSYTAPFTQDKDTGKLLYNGVDVDSIQKDDAGYFYEVTDPDTGDKVRKEIPMDGDVYMDVGLGIKMSGPNVDPDTGFLISFSGLDFLGFGTDTDGLSNNIFNILNEVRESIGTYDAEKLDAADDKLSKLTDGFRTHLTDIGARTGFLSTIEGRLSDTVDSYSRRISDLIGVNDAEEATNQSMNDYVLKAVLQMGSRILPVSLMDFLG